MNNSNLSEENASVTTANLTDMRRRLMFVNIIITCIATSLLSTALTTALPPIVAEFEVSVTTGQWLTSSYSLVMAITMPLTAFLVKRFPTKPLYVVSIGLFLVGSGICTVAPGFAPLLAGRILQAAAAGMLNAMAQVVILSIYPIEKRGTVMGWYGLAIGAAPIVAPTLAGLMVDTLGWRTIFILAFVIMLVSFVWALLVFGNVLETSHLRFDTLSFILSACAFGGITLGIGNLSSGLNAFSIVPLAVGALGTALFIRRQLHLETPFLEVRTFTNPVFATAVACGALLYLVIMGAQVIVPLCIQTAMGCSATVSGLTLLPGSIVSTVLNPVAGKAYDRVGMRILAIAGAVILLVGTFGMCLVPADGSLVVVALLNVLRNVAVALMLMPFVTWGISGVRKEHTADGTALINALNMVASAIGIAAFVGVMNVGTVGAGAAADAAMQGVHLAFAAMSAAAVLLLVVALVRVKGERT